MPGRAWGLPVAALALSSVLAVSQAAPQGVRATRHPATTLVIDGPRGAVPMRLGISFYPLSRTPAGPSSLRAPVVFAGYGITAPEEGYDDYATVDVRGAAVVVLTHEPEEAEPTSRFAGRALTPHAGVGRKAEVARDRGAALMLLVEDPLHATDRARTTDWPSDPQIDDYALPVLRVDRLRLERALGLDIEGLARDIDHGLVPRSRPVPGTLVRYDRDQEGLQWAPAALCPA